MAAKNSWTRAAFWALVALLGGIVVAYRAAVLEYRAEHDDLWRAIRAELVPIRSDLSRELSGAIYLTYGVASLIAVEGDIGEDQFRAIAAELLRHNDLVRNIAIAPGNVIRDVYPREGNEQAIGLNYRDKSDQWPAVERMLAERKLVVAGPLRLVQGGIGVIGRTPIYIRHSAAVGEELRYWGLASTVIDFERLFARTPLADASTRVAIAVRGTDGLGERGEVFWGNAAIFKADPVLTDVTLPSGRWQLGAIPLGGWPEFRVLGSANFRIVTTIAFVFCALLFRVLQSAQKLQGEVSQRRRADAELLRRVSELDGLNALGRRVSGTLLLDEVIAAAVQEIVHVVQPDAVFLFLREGERLLLKQCAPESALSRFGDMPEHRVGECLCGTSVKTGQAIYSLDIDADRRCTWFECKRARMKSFAALPLRSGEEFIGVLGLSSERERDFESQAPFLETLASQVAVGMRNAMLHQSVAQHASELELRVAQRTAELEVACERAEAADRLKSAFLATMSHELRTPLNSIIGFTGILLQNLPGPLNEEQRKQLGLVQSSSRHLLALINDVLDISKIEADELRLHHAEFELRPILDRVVAAMRPMAEAKHLALSATVDPSIGGMVSDARRVEQILLNLLNNAVKFTEQGSVTLAATTTADRLQVTVTDTGIGIRPEEIAQLFRPFQQVESGLSRAHEGTGLGLAICQRLARMLGGRIAVHSVFGKGSTFTIELPLRH